MQIESRTLGEICYNHILPATLDYQTRVAENVNQLRQLGMADDKIMAQMDILQRMNDCIQGIMENVKKMTIKRNDANILSTALEVAESYCQEIKPIMEELRTYVDRLEYLVDDKDWPLVKYRELMFLR
jgi:glutamine synthetase